MSAMILGVAGGTGSGKTTVAREILEAVGADRIAFLAQDNYYRDVAWESPDQLVAYNFDHPDALDTRLLVEHLRALKSGRSIDLPVYDFVSHRRTASCRRIEARPVVLVEGILLFAEPEIRELLDFKVFVDTDADLRFIRRLQRDVVERGRTPESIVEQYLATVRPSHEQFIEPSKRHADVIFPQGGMNDQALEVLLARVRELVRVD